MSDLRAAAKALITARRQSVRPDANFWLALDNLEAALAAPQPEPPAGLRNAGRCGCNCICHITEPHPEWPGPCAACCEPGMNCDCGRALAAAYRATEEEAT